MFSSTILAFVGTALASSPLMAREALSPLPLYGLAERQLPCKPVTAPVTCERSCGPGYAECTPSGLCYNAGGGDVCCSDGTGCPAGTYCTDGGCCPDEMSLDECGATVTLTIIPPTRPSATAQPEQSEEPSSPPEPTSSDEPEESTVTPEPTSSEEPTSDDTSIIPEPTSAAPTTTEQPPVSSSSSSAEDVPTSPAPTPTGGASQIGENVLLAALSGLFINYIFA
jgi:hypothetical protein